MIEKDHQDDPALLLTHHHHPPVLSLAGMDRGKYDWWWISVQLQGQFTLSVLFKGPRTMPLFKCLKFATSIWVPDRPSNFCVFCWTLYSLGNQPCHYPLIHLNCLVAAAVQDKILHQSELLWIAFPEVLHGMLNLLHQLKSWLFYLFSYTKLQMGLGSSNLLPHAPPGLQGHSLHHQGLLHSLQENLQCCR